MHGTSRKPEPPQPLPPTGKESDPAPTRDRLSVTVSLLIFLLLGGWHLWGVQTRPRPSEMHRESVLRTLDLNRATKTELLQLPGVGPSLADKILSYRHLNGSFRHLDELKEIHGVGDATFAKLRPHFILSDAPEEEPSVDPEPLKLARKPEPKKEPIVHVVQKPNLDGLIDINNAPQKDLESLPGIGPILAKRIIDEREKQPFAKVDDLKRVNGIGVKKAEQLRERVKFGSRE